MFETRIAHARHGDQQLAGEAALRVLLQDEHAHAPVLTRSAVVAFRDHYLGDGPDAVGERDPIVSPLLGRHEGLPPALIQTADLDPIRDDGLRFAAALEQAGVPVRLTNYLGAPHGFSSFPGAYRSGAASRRELVDFLRRHLDGTRAAPVCRQARMPAL